MKTEKVSPEFLHKLADHAAGLDIILSVWEESKSDNYVQVRTDDGNAFRHASIRLVHIGMNILLEVVNGWDKETPVFVSPVPSAVVAVLTRE